MNNFFDKLNENAKAFGVQYISESSFFSNYTLKNWPVIKQIDETQGPLYLYHYTTQETAFKILQSRTIRASDSSFLNDSLEIEIGRRALCKAVKKLELDANDRLNKAFTEAVEFLTRRSETDGRELLALARQRAYTASFSTLPDVLSQWRGYAGSSGVALGFGTAILSKTEPDALLAPVVYGTENDFVDIICEDFIYLSEHSALRKAKSSDLHSHLVERYALILPLLKSNSFASEKEWRLVLTEAQVDRRDAEWRFSNRYAIPFVELCLWPGFDDQTRRLGLKHRYLPLCEPILGPEAHPLAKHYYDHMIGRWKQSAISFRT